MTEIGNFLNQRLYKNRVVTLTGVSGVGKDHLIARAQLDGTINVFHFGSELFKLAGKPNGLESKDQLKTLPETVLNSYTRTTVGMLLSSQPVLLVTHVVQKQEEDLIVSPQLEALINARQYLFVKSDPKLIWRRRATDSSRLRDMETVEQITLHQHIAVLSTVCLARYIGAEFICINNNLDNTDQATRIIWNSVNQLLEK